MPRAVLFDWDNTLVDTWPAIHHAYQATFEAMWRTPWTLEETRDRVRASARDSFPALFGDRAEEAATVFYGSFEASHLETLRELRGAGDMLCRLSDDGYYLAVVSNKRADLLRQEADALGWAPLFEQVVGANDAARDKPALEPDLLALEGSGIAPGESVWFVGDTDIDMTCAARTGCVPVLLRAQPPGNGEFGGHGPAHYVPSCLALADRLDDGPEQRPASGQGH